MRFIPALSLIGSLFPLAANAAYVQNQPCKGLQHVGDGEQTASTSVRLEPSENGDGELITWQITKYLPTADCEALLPNVTVAFTVELLGSSSEYRVVGNATCKKLKGPFMEGKSAFKVPVTQELNQLYPLSTFHTVINMFDGSSNAEIGCQQVNVTPGLTPTLSAVLQWVPIAIFVFVFVVEALWALNDSTQAPVSPVDDESEIESPASRPAMLNVADCINYIQFVFLTGSLSLFYPGFYMPVVSHLSWASLFYKIPITQNFTYPGIRDGVYEINGTYGGTYGLEVMHQIVGAPLTMQTWLNMVLAVLVIAFACVLLRFCIQMLHKRCLSNNQSLYMGAPQDPNVRTPWSIWVLRIIFSYFMMPLAAFSFYQFDNAYILPAYHTVLSAGVISLILLLFAWSLYQMPIRTLGQLVFDTSKRYQRLPTENDNSGGTYDATFIWILFILSFVRGVAVGGLQFSPLAQITTLSTCEVILLISIYSFRAYPFFSISTISAIVRLISLILMTLFIRGLTTGKVRSIAGYAILLLHTWLLILGFLCPALHSLWKLGSTKIEAAKPDAYSLRQLNRREPSRMNLSSRLSSAPSHLDPNSPAPSPRDFTATSPFQNGSFEGKTINSPTNYQEYFRAPRQSTSSRKLGGLASSTITSHSRDGRNFSSPSQSSQSSSRSERRVLNGAEVSEDGGSVHSYSRSTSSATISLDGSPRNTPATENLQYAKIRSTPLGPRWDDYSFRESDLIYKAPRPLDAKAWSQGVTSSTSAGGSGGAAEFQSTAESQSRLSSLRTVASEVWSTLGIKGKAPAPQERGFQVSRPANPGFRIEVTGAVSPTPAPEKEDV